MEPTELTPEQLEAEKLADEKARLAFISKHADRITQWFGVYPNSSPPILKNRDGYYWVNRKARRGMK